MPTYTSNTVVRVPAKPGADDRALLRDVGRRMADIVVAGNDLPPRERAAKIAAQLETLRGVGASA